MIWLPYANVRANLDVLKLEHIFDVVYEGMQCLRDIYSGVLGRDVRMWHNQPAALLAYVAAAEKEVRGRGLQGEPRVIRAHVALSRAGYPLAPVPPSWYGSPEFHIAQRSHLIRVDPVHYARRLPFTTPIDIPLVWPSERKTK